MEIIAFRNFPVGIYVLTSVLFVAGQDQKSIDPCPFVVDIEGSGRDVSRVFEPSSTGICDRDLVEGWYRFTAGGQPRRIPTKCLRNNVCGTALPYWLDLGEGVSLPLPGTEITASYCAAYDVLGTVDCCVLRAPARVYNCGVEGKDDFVYLLVPTDRCPVAYCTYDPGLALDPRYTTTKGQNASELTQLSAPETVVTDAQWTSLEAGTSLKADTTGTASPLAEMKVTESPSPGSNLRTNTGAVETSKLTQGTKPGETGKTPSGPSASVGSSSSTEVPKPLPSDPIDAGNVTDAGSASLPDGSAEQTQNTSQTTAPESSGNATETPTGSTQTTIGVYPGETPYPGKTIFIDNSQEIKSSTRVQMSELITDAGQAIGHSTNVKFISNLPAPSTAAPKSPKLQTSSPNQTTTIANMSTDGPTAGSDQTSAEKTLSASRTAASSAERTTASPVEGTTAAPNTTEPTTQAQTTSSGPPTSPPTTNQPQRMPSKQSPTPVVGTSQAVTQTEEATTVSTKHVTTKETTVKHGTIGQDFVILKITGKKITSARVRQALILGIRRRCEIGVDSASPAVVQVFTRYRLCEFFRRTRTRRQADPAPQNGGLNPLLSDSFEDLSGTFHTNLALEKSNGTSSVVIPEQDLLTLLGDDEIKNAFLAELEVDSAEVCPKADEGCSVIRQSDPTRTGHGHERGPDVMKSYFGLVIAMILIGALFLLLAIAIVIYLKCRSQRGSWNRNRYTNPERSHLNGNEKNSGAIENPATDAEILKDEGEMREKSQPQTPVNGGGHHGNYPDEDNGWVVPFDQLTAEERALPALSDTKL